MKIVDQRKKDKKTLISELKQGETFVLSDAPGCNGNDVSVFMTIKWNDSTGNMVVIDLTTGQEIEIGVYHTQVKKVKTILSVYHDEE